MKANLLLLLAVMTFSTGSAVATEYIYRDLMANTLTGPKCESKVDAQESAEKPYRMKRYAKKFCQSQGYGWHVEEVKNNGKMVCNECMAGNQDTYQCFKEDVVVSCKRIKPGSVGMLPGKG